MYINFSTYYRIISLWLIDSKKIALLYNASISNFSFLEHISQNSRKAPLLLSVWGVGADELLNEPFRKLF